MIDEKGLDCRLEIDGGIKAENIAEVASAGIDTFVIGSGIFGQRNEDDRYKYDSILKEIRNELKKADH